MGENWVMSHLACPYDGKGLVADGDPYADCTLSCAAGHTFPVVQGIPVLLRSDLPETLWVMRASRDEAATWQNGDRRDPYFVGTLGLSEEQRDEVAKRVASHTSGVDPVISFLIASTSGNLYLNLIGSLSSVPIPELRLPKGRGVLVDVGSNWGRWSIAAAELGYAVIGVDPSLGALLAAQRMARSKGANCRFVCADARAMPLRDRSVDRVFSYSVIQHFSKDDAKAALKQIARVLAPGGSSFIQMPNAFGLRSAYVLARRGGHEGRDFDVRYWRPSELARTFSELIGPSTLSVDGYFGLGIQESDRAILPFTSRCIVAASALVRRLSLLAPPLVNVADSLYVTSQARDAALTDEASTVAAKAS